MPILAERRIWRRAWFAYVAPFALFLLLTALEGRPELRPWYPWVYAAKIAVATAAWWYYRDFYPAYSSKGLLPGLVVGVLGVVCWIVVARLGLERVLAEYAPSVFGGARVGYNPFEEIASPAGRWAFIAVRLFGLAVAISLIEEVFWRGFLLRYLISEDFEKIPIGTYTPMSFATATILFAAVHPEILAALLWGAAINGLLYATRNLWSTIAAHATTNLLLGVYVLWRGAWELW